MSSPLEEKPLPGGSDIPAKPSAATGASGAAGGGLVSNAKRINPLEDVRQDLQEIDQKYRQREQRRFQQSDEGQLGQINRVVGGLQDGVSEEIERAGVVGTQLVEKGIIDPLSGGSYEVLRRVPVVGKLAHTLVRKTTTWGLFIIVGSVLGTLGLVFALVGILLIGSYGVYAEINDRVANIVGEGTVEYLEDTAVWLLSEDPEFRLAVMERAEEMIASGELPREENEGLLNRAYANDAAATEALGMNTIRRALISQPGTDLTYQAGAQVGSRYDFLDWLIDALWSFVSDEEDSEKREEYLAQIRAAQGEQREIANTYFPQVYANGGEQNVQGVASGINTLGSSEAVVGAVMEGQAEAQWGEMPLALNVQGQKINEYADQADSCWFESCRQRATAGWLEYFYNSALTTMILIEEGQVQDEQMEAMGCYFWPDACDEDDPVARLRIPRALASDSNINIDASDPLSVLDRSAEQALITIEGYLEGQENQQFFLRSLFSGCQGEQPNNTFFKIQCASGDVPDVYLNDQNVEPEVDGDSSWFDSFFSFFDSEEEANGEFTASTACDYSGVPNEIARHVERGVREANIDCTLLLAVLTIENGGNLPDPSLYQCLTSSAGAKGYAQITDSTWNGVSNQVASILGREVNQCGIEESIIASALIIDNKIDLHVNDRTTRILYCQGEDGSRDTFKIDGAIDTETEVRCVYEVYNGSDAFGDRFVNYYQQFALEE